MILLKSNNYYEEDEKLFSTGNSELDDILEEVYYSGIEDGYEYAQREFAAPIPVKAIAKGPKLKPIKRDINAVINRRVGPHGAAKITNGGKNAVITDAKAVNNLPRRVRSELGFKGRLAAKGDKIPLGNAESAAKVFSE